ISGCGTGGHARDNEIIHSFGRNVLHRMDRGVALAVEHRFVECADERPGFSQSTDEIVVELVARGLDLFEFDRTAAGFERVLDRGCLPEREVGPSRRQSDGTVARVHISTGAGRFKPPSRDVTCLASPHELARPSSCKRLYRIARPPRGVTKHAFGDLRTAAYCPRQCYYRRRDDDRGPPPDIEARRELAHPYDEILARADHPDEPTAVTHHQLITN